MTDAPRYVHHPSPVGDLLLVACADGLRAIGFPDPGRGLEVEPGWIEDRVALAHVSAQLDAYFAGRRRGFDLTLSPRGTPFQRLVWDALRDVPYGTTTTYGALARRIGRPKASRAVGLANGHNPLPIVVPCHRVIGADGSLTGFGGGLAAKRLLLDLERDSPQLSLL